MNRMYLALAGLALAMIPVVSPAKETIAEILSDPALNLDHPAERAKAVDRIEFSVDAPNSGLVFAKNGYPHTLNSGSSFGGLAAWTGNSGGFIETVIEFTDTPKFADKSLQIRWTLATDLMGKASGAHVGWHVDTILLTGSLHAKWTGMPITISPATRHQEMEGFGAALSWHLSSVYRNNEARDTAIEQAMFEDLGLDNLGWTPDYLSFQNEPGYQATWETCLFDPNETTNRPGPIVFVPGGDVTRPGIPAIMNYPAAEGNPPFRAVFGRRKNHVAAGLTYTVEFSANLLHWDVYQDEPSVLSDGQNDSDVEAVGVPFPASVPTNGNGHQSPQFFRVSVSMD